MEREGGTRGTVAGWHREFEFEHTKKSVFVFHTRLCTFSVRLITPACVFVSARVFLRLS
jgi:hypothetical protein